MPMFGRKPEAVLAADVDAGHGEEHLMRVVVLEAPELRFLHDVRRAAGLRPDGCRGRSTSSGVASVGTVCACGSRRHEHRREHERRARGCASARRRDAMPGLR